MFAKTTTLKKLIIIYNKDIKNIDESIEYYRCNPIFVNHFLGRKKEVQEEILKTKIKLGIEEYKYKSLS